MMVRRGSRQDTGKERRGKKRIKVKEHEEDEEDVEEEVGEVVSA